MKIRPLLLLLPALWALDGCQGDGGDRAFRSRGDADSGVAASSGETGRTGDAPADAPGPAGPAIAILDVSGRRLELSTTPSRIVSLVPSASQTLIALGEGHRLVGRTDFDTAASLAHLPSVGGGLHPSPEALVALEPDVVILFAGESDTDTPRLLDQMGIPSLTIRPNRIRDVREIIRDLGTLTGRSGKADTLLSEMDAALAGITEGVRGLRRPRVAYLLGGVPPWVAGPGSYVEELIRVAGGENAFSDLGAPFGPVSVEAFLVGDLDVLVAADGVEISLPVEGIPIRRVSPGVEIPGPHLAESALELARALHPEVFR